MCLLGVGTASRRKPPAPAEGTCILAVKSWVILNAMHQQREYGPAPAGSAVDIADPAALEITGTICQNMPTKTVSEGRLLGNFR